MRIFIISKGNESFVLQDVEILKDLGYDVVLINSWFCKELILGKFDLVISWFFSRHSLIPLFLVKMYGKRIYCITGGHDTACLPEIKYGIRRYAIINFIMNILLNFFDKIIVNSNYIVNELENRGFVNNEITVAHHFIRQNDLKFNEENTRKKQIVFVGGVNTSNLERKGLRFFLETSKIINNYEFICAGRIDYSLNEYLKDFPLVKFTNYIPEDELIDLIKSSSIILQPSLHEAFGLAVVEAMSFGVVPIISHNSCGLVEVAGKYAYYIEDFVSVQSLILSIEKTANLAYRRDMSFFVLNEYSKQKRLYKFKELIEEC